ncbi:hypothetical protein ACFL6C_13075, partial [Myxococcota bacterium]
YYLRVYTPTSPREVGASQRHLGAWNDGRYRLVSGTSGTVLSTHLSFFHIDGLQVKQTNNDSGFRGIWCRDAATNSMVRISNNIIVGPHNTADTHVAWGIQVGSTDADSSSAGIWNNVIYDMGTANLCAGIVNHGSGHMHAYNNTIVGADGAIKNSAGGILVAKNNVAVGCRYSSSLDDRSTNNASSDGSAPDQSPILLSSDDPLDYFLGSADFHIDPLAPNANELIGAGVDLSNDVDWPFTRDIDGSVRTLPWDVGADEVDP